nr:chromosome transmission fidelity protein 4 [Cryptococcus depauperatus CBS 7841]
MAEPSPDAITSLASHLAGITRLCFSPDGATIFTGGSDCLVRIHQADSPDSEPGFYDEHDEPVTAMACSANDFISGSVDNIVRRFSYPQNKFTGFITRSSGVPIRWLSIDKTGERVAVCSDDMVVKIVNLQDTSKISLISDNNKPVRSASWDPLGKYLATACCDGKLRIYDTSGSTPICVKVFEGVIPPSDSDSNVSCYAQWHPSGSFFAVPTRTNDIAILSREGWNKQATFTPDGPKALIGEIGWSPNGKYLAASASFNLYIFSTDSRQLVASYICFDGAISGLAFSPISNLLVFTSLDGSFHRWKEPISENLPDPYTSEAAQQKKLDRLLDDEFGEDEDMEDKGEELGDEGDLFGDNEWIVDDGGHYADDGKDDERKWGAGRTEVVNVTKAQPAFTPGSTAFKNKKRYLAFNMIGVIDVTDQESHNVVNVEFHDKSVRRGYHFQDHNKFTIASLGEQGIVYACPSEDDQPSLVYYRPYDSWSAQSDWTISLLPGEEAVCVAVGGQKNPESGMGSVVVATSKGYVRFLTASGMQRYLWKLGEDVVTMAAGKDLAIIVHREGGTSLDGCQNLRYNLIDLEDFDIIQQGKIPVPKKTTLTWVGFTGDGAPAIYDSTGLVSVLDRYKSIHQARWVPLLDTTLLAKDGRKETYWPIGVSSTSFSCIVLKGLEKEPWFPRPLIQEVELHMPFLNPDTQQGKLEESLVRGSITIGNLHGSSDHDAAYLVKEAQVNMDKTMIQLVQGACKADNLQRALDVTRLMHNASTVDAAAKVAAFYHLPGLQERMQNLKTEKEMRKQYVRREERQSLSGVMNKEHHGSLVPTASSSKPFTDFAPRSKGSRRSFGGVNRDSTPASIPNSTYIPETPNTEAEMTPSTEADDNQSFPEAKRKWEERDELDWDRKKKESALFAKPESAPKNPFAKKSDTFGSNPFTKNGISKPLDAVKSKSFFNRVDDLEANGAPKPKKTKINKEKAESLSGGRQQTLFGVGGMSKAAKSSLSDAVPEQSQPDYVPETLIEEPSVVDHPLDEEQAETAAQRDERTLLRASN